MFIIKSCRRAEARRQQEPFPVPSLIAMQQGMLPAAIRAKARRGGRRFCSQLLEITAAIRELHNLAKRGQRSARNNRRASSIVAQSLPVQKGSYCGESTPQPGNNIDGSNMGMLLNTTHSATKSLHDSQGSLHIVIIAEVLCSVATVSWPSPSIKSSQDCMWVHLAQVLWCQAKPLQACGRAVHHHDIRISDQSLEGSPACDRWGCWVRAAFQTILDIEKNALFAHVGRQAVNDGDLWSIGGCWCIDFYNLGSEAGQSGTNGWPSNDVCQVHNLNALQPRSRVQVC
mmetsp:Transcript_20035/g.46642  ORF Transcript_20035/g.46642 Transcript_20035/m.46642 type:complete len:286 (-) Transcript_20035:1394-2251(-)